MKKYLFILTIGLTLNCLTSVAQISKTGYDKYSWGANKSNFNNLKTCNPSFVDPEVENCSANDSIFLKEFEFEYLNYRFYKKQLFEVNYDFNRNLMTKIISKLTIDLGSPMVKEKKDQGINNFTAYEWIIGDSKVLIIDKGTKLPIWLNISSIKVKSSISNRSNIDLEKILFGEL